MYFLRGSHLFRIPLFPCKPIFLADYIQDRLNWPPWWLCPRKRNGWGWCWPCRGRCKRSAILRRCSPPCAVVTSKKCSGSETSKRMLILSLATACEYIIKAWQLAGEFGEYKFRKFINFHSLECEFDEYTKNDICASLTS